MPKQVGKSSLADKVGRGLLQKAHEAHKDDETRVFGGGLPPGISNGIAQVTDCKFDVYKSGPNQGEYYFFASASVKKPTEHNGVPIKGMSTRIGPEPICETPNLTRKTVEQHWDWILNQLRLLGVDTSKMDYERPEATAEAVKKRAPYIRFETRLGKATPAYPNPRTFESWLGFVADYKEGSSDDEVADETQTTEDTPSPSPTETLSEIDEDLRSLGERADEGDQAAQRALTSRARLHDLDPETYATWMDVAVAINFSDATEGAKEEDSPEEEEATEESQEEMVPGVGEVFFYRTPGPGRKKPVECEVTAVFKVSKKCNLKNMDDGTLYKSVEWSKLQQQE